MLSSQDSLEVTHRAAADYEDDDFGQGRSSALIIESKLLGEDREGHRMVINLRQSAGRYLAKVYANPTTGAAT